MFAIAVGPSDIVMAQMGFCLQAGHIFDRDALSGLSVQQVRGCLSQVAGPPTMNYKQGGCKRCAAADLD